MLSFTDIQTEITNRVMDNENLLNSTWFGRQVPEVYSYIITKTGGFWLYGEGTFTTASGTAEYPLDSDVLIIRQMIDTTNRRPIARMFSQEEVLFDADRSQSGPPRGYFGTFLREYQAQPTAASVLTVVSTSAADDIAADTNAILEIKGKIAGNYDVYETVELDGLTPVNSVNTYIAGGIRNLSRRAVSAGTWTITSNAAAVVNAVFQPVEKRVQYPWIRMVPESGDARGVRYSYIRKPQTYSIAYGYLDVPEFFEECAMMRFEEMANRTLRQFKMADDVMMRNEKLIAERLKFLNQKPDQFVTWQGNGQEVTDFLTEVYNANMP